MLTRPLVRKVKYFWVRISLYSVCCYTNYAKGARLNAVTVVYFAVSVY